MNLFSSLILGGALLLIPGSAFAGDKDVKAEKKECACESCKCKECKCDACKCEGKDHCDSADKGGCDHCKSKK